MKRTLPLHLPPDYYEILVSGHIIFRITCWVGEDQRPRTISLADLPEDIQSKIIDSITKDTTNNDNGN